MGTRHTLMPLWHVMRGGLKWILYDSFGTPDAAPIADPLYPDPGPGLSVIVDTGNKFSITNGDLVCSAGTAAWGDPGIWLGYDNAGTPAAYTMSAGLAHFSNISIASGEHFTPSFDADFAGSGATPFFYFSTSNVLKVQHDGAVQTPVGVYVDGTPTQLLTIQRSTNGHHFVQDGTLVWVENDAAQATAFVALNNHSAAFSCGGLGLIDLPANGYTDWAADFSTVTDSKTNPVTTTTFTTAGGTAGFHARMKFTPDATSATFNFDILYADGNNRVNIYNFGGDNLTIREVVLGAQNALANVNGCFTSNPHVLDVVVADGQLSAWVDNVLKVAPVSLNAALLPNTGGVITFTAGTVQSITTHPYPALGIATDRVIAPRLNDTGTMTADAVCVIRDVTLPPVTLTDYVFRRASASSYMMLRFEAAGTCVLYDYDGGFDPRILGGAGTVSNGDDVVIVFDGADCEVFVAGTSIGTTAAATEILGTGFLVAGTNSGTADAVELWPRDVSSILPPELT